MKLRFAITGYIHPFGAAGMYGGERIIWYLAQEYINMGHDVTVFSVKGCVLPGCNFIEMPKPYDDNKDIYAAAIEEEEKKHGLFDFIQSYMASGKISETLRNKSYCLEPFFGFKDFKENIITCSKRLNDFDGGNATVIYYGIPSNFYTKPELKDDGYLTWIGAITPDKAPHIAIEVAKRCGKKLILMGNSYHYPYFVDSIWPHIDNDKIIWMRGVNDSIKKRVLSKSFGFLSTNWNHFHEMFGIVNIESLACGTPVIGWGKKNEPSAINNAGGEIITHGTHGFINEYDSYSNEDMEKSIDKAVDYVNQLKNISRGECYSLYEKRFTSKIMAEKHLKYYDLVKKHGKVLNLGEI